uniref:Transmembrane protein 220 n=2 Tax=Chenopodium quinoa TaxID=63459 RepID=A0A803KW05_CHEQI
MAALFLVSASVQFNDPEWYFWIPLYSCGAYVNLMSSLATVSLKRSKSTGKLTLWLGIFLLTKVLLEDYFGDMIGIWSLDMRHRLVREKIGSGLVTSSMILQLSSEMDPRKNMELGSYIECGNVFGQAHVL